MACVLRIFVVLVFFWSFTSVTFPGNMGGGEKIAQRWWHLRGEQRGRKRSEMGREVEEDTVLGSGLCLKPALPPGNLHPYPDVMATIDARWSRVSSGRTS